MADLGYKSYDDWFEEWWKQNYVPTNHYDWDRLIKDWSYKTSRPDYNDYVRDYLYSGVLNKKLDPLDVQGEAAGLGIQWTPEQSEYIGNMLSQKATNEERAYETNARDTSLISTANQLSDLGLNTGSVVSLGGASAGVNSNAANLDSNYSQNKALAQFQAKASMARTILSTISGLASVGIGGSAMAVSKIAAARIASSMAHSVSTFGADGLLKSYSIHRNFSE